MSKVIVNVEDALALMAARRAMNEIPFTNIEWHINGKPAALPEGYVEDWCFVGLSNLFLAEHTWEGKL